MSEFSGKKRRVILNAMVKDTKAWKSKEFSTHLASRDFTGPQLIPLTEGKTDHFPDLLSRHMEGTQAVSCASFLREI